jgi:cytochrome d ubiquinol oxidase subunit I
MLMAAYLATAFVVAGLAASYLLNGRFVPLARPMLSLALMMISPIAPLQIAVGDEVGLVVRDYQPAKLAAMEAQWRAGVMPLRLFAVPRQAEARNSFELGIPKLGSLITEHSTTAPGKGLLEFPAADWPRVAIVFWSFRIMVGIGLLMLAIALTACVLGIQKRLYSARWFLRLLTFTSPLGFVAILAGWYTAEIGRQPYVLYGFLRTADAVSPIAASEVSVSLCLFFGVYSAVFGAGFWYLIRALRKGPIEVELPAAPTLGQRLLAATFAPKRQR